MHSCRYSFPYERSDAERIATEIQCLESLNHVNVIKLYEVREIMRTRGEEDRALLQGNVFGCTTENV